jgi:hypothetical protein
LGYLLLVLSGGHGGGVMRRCEQGEKTRRYKIKRAEKRNSMGTPDIMSKIVARNIV